MSEMSAVLPEVACKICNNATELHGCVDSGRSCEINRGMFQPLTGEPIYYRRCLTCGFLFTTAFDDWSVEEFRQKIYNTDYALVDPDYASGARARKNAAVTAALMRRFHLTRVLDYGGGDGTMARLLRHNGFDAHSWDPIADSGGSLPQPGSFPLVTAFEVLEHTPNPVATVAEATGLLQYRGRLVFSTLLLDQLPRYATDHWYIAPRNGHISLHTRLSLGRMFAQLGWSVRSLEANLHIAEQYKPSIPDA
jgi:hypothetical protein